MLFMCCSFLSLRRSVGFEESQQIAGWFFFECDGAIGFVPPLSHHLHMFYSTTAVSVDHNERLRLDSMV